MPEYSCNGCNGHVALPVSTHCLECKGKGRKSSELCPIHSTHPNISFGGPCICSHCECITVDKFCYGCLCRRCNTRTPSDGRAYSATETECSECQCTVDECKNVSQNAFTTGETTLCTYHLQQSIQQLQKRQRERETKETSRLLQPLLCMNTMVNDDGKIANCGKHAKITTRYSCRVLGYMRCDDCTRFFNHHYTFQDYVKAFNDLNNTTYGIRPNDVTRQPTYDPNWDNGVFKLKRP